MRYFSVKNFERFQHYKSRGNGAKPTWIKTYHSLLTDFDFQQLSDVAKAHLMLIWVLASRVDNRIPYDAKWVSARIGSEKTVDLDVLEQHGWIVLEQPEKPVLEQFDECVSPLLSSSLISEEYKNPRCELETDSENDPVTADELMESWNSVAGDLGLALVREISGSRAARIRLRVKEHPAADWWRGVFRNIRGSPFCQGVNDKKWKISFDWLFENDNNALKVYEGKYLHEAAQEPGYRSNGRRDNQGAGLFDLQQKPR